MYKLFKKIITTRLEKKLDENQPREQAGFRNKYSTTDHIGIGLHAINQEKCRDYNIPLCVASVDYKKAFDSVQTQAILISLQKQGIEDVYIEILKDIYTDSSVTVYSVLPRPFSEGGTPCRFLVTPCPFQEAEMTPCPFLGDAQRRPVTFYLTPNVTVHGNRRGNYAARTFPLFYSTAFVIVIRLTYTYK